MIIIHRTKTASSLITPHCGVLVPLFIEGTVASYPIEYGKQQLLWNDVLHFAQQCVADHHSFYDGLIMNKTFEIASYPVHIYYMVMRQPIKINPSILRKYILIAVCKHWETAYDDTHQNVIIPLFQRINISRKLVQNFLSSRIPNEPDLHIHFCPRFPRSLCE